MPAARPRVPHARRDPVITPDEALAIVELAASSRPRHETIAFLLDDCYRGTGLITVVSDTVDFDCVIRIAEVMAELGALSQGIGRETAYVVIASIRPWSDMEPDDAFRWCSASDIVENHGMTLLEWFVLGPSGPVCPRELLGEEPRWPSI
jgi:hypothetical protein